MVYGERLNTFDESRKDLLDFQNAAVRFIELISAISNAPPLYKYFPTKIYRRFVAAVTCVHEHGTFMVICMYMMLCAHLYVSVHCIIIIHAHTVLYALVWYVLWLS